MLSPSLWSLSIGTVTAMPLSIFVDLVINGQVLLFLIYLGMALIAIGFIGFCISEFVAARNESAVEQQFAHHESFLTMHTPFFGRSCVIDKQNKK